MKRFIHSLILALFAGATVHAVAQVEYEPIPPSILTPDRVETRLGTLEFFDGYPKAETVEAVYDNLDFQRGVRAFLDSLPIASLYAMREGLREVGAVNGTVGIFENLMDARTLFLTANTESVYAVTWLDLEDGPMVVESAPNTLGILDDFFFGHVTDLGNAGPDRGQDGRFLILPPGYDGDVPEGYYTFTSRTFGNWLIWRGFLEDGDPQPAMANLKANIRIYPLARREERPASEFVNLSGLAFNTIHANDLSFYEEVHAVIQEEPVDALDPEFLGLLAAIGIEKGQPFAPDARMTEILTDAAAVGNATARALVFRTRDPASYLFASDTDFTVKLVDVHPDGAAWNVDDTIIRARYREGYDRQVMMEEGEVYELRPTPMSTSYTFNAGHRIRVEVSSSKFPQYMRNLNTGGNNYDETESVIAVNTLHHTEQYPSRVELSVVP
jgi:hypothetical protein